MNAPFARHLRISVIVAAAAVCSLPAARAATVTTTGCASAAFCSLGELIAGGSMRIDDLLFDNFSNFSVVPTNNAGFPIPVPAADDIRVHSQGDELGALGVPGELGLAYDFRVDGSPIILLDGAQSLVMHWEYDVIAVGTGNRLVDNTLLFPAGIHDGASIQNTVDVPDNATLQVTEQALDPATGEGIVRKIIVATGSATPISDHRDFAPMASLHIVTDINAFGGDAGTGVNLALDWMVQSFSQQVPAPASAVLLVSALLGMVCGGRRRARVRAPA